MKQKMWVRKIPHYGGSWETGCQCCGYLVLVTTTWVTAMAEALRHARRHA